MQEVYWYKNFVRLDSQGRGFVKGFILWLTNPTQMKTFLFIHFWDWLSNFFKLFIFLLHLLTRFFKLPIFLLHLFLPNLCYQDPPKLFKLVLGALTFIVIFQLFVAHSLSCTFWPFGLHKKSFFDCLPIPMALCMKVI